MSRPAIIGAAAVPVLAAPLPVFAQATVLEPGIVLFYHSNADVLRADPGYGYGGPPVYGWPCEAHAYVGGRVVVEEADPTYEPVAPVHHRGRNYWPY
jgi:hypothetical protein